MNWSHGGHGFSLIERCPWNSLFSESDTQNSVAASYGKRVTKKDLKKLTGSFLRVKIERKRERRSGKENEGGREIGEDE